MAVVCSFIQLTPSINSIDEKVSKTIHVTTNGIHTSIVLPLHDISNFIDLTDFAGYQGQQYLMIGWGDKDFYMNVPQWSDLTLKTALTSTFIPTDSALHLTLLETPAYLAEINTYQLNNQQYQALLSAITDSAVMSNNRFIVYKNQSHSSIDNFYQANGSYHLFNTCNSWTNHIMKEAGLPHSLWTPFSFAVMRNKSD